jgi:HD-like signal output (HDOD) protein
LAAETIAEHLGLSRNTAYISGLLRGLGTMVLDRFGGGKMPPHLTYDPSEFDTYTRWELTRFGVTSTSVTTMALDEWHFPEEVVTAIELHLEPPDGNDEAERLAAVLNLAGAIAVEHGRALPGEVLHWNSATANCERLGLGDWEYTNLVQRASAAFDQQKAALY